MFLTDLGAEDIRIKHPNDSDSMRDWGPLVNDQSTYYLFANRNKKLITLNLKSLPHFNELVKEADIIFENF